ncbi:DUF6924 domain-containing protein [Nocardioides baculatus]|uniref:DUF6924 domain-containing protein n=1 Tax=Nocardioides baculatus TaxID=2801337 RepID=A0ABS1L9B5_9ACTN|nr:hypothetical protein [Nocardioides baculatus]MBL0748220.1 hypothetical protein [Nocardioides baculatus]
MDISDLIDAMEDELTPLVRIDFTDDAAWAAVVRAVRTPVTYPGEEPIEPDVVVVDDRAYDGVTPTALGEQAVQEGGGLGYALLADARSMAEAAGGGEVTVAYVDLSVEDEEDAELLDSFPGNTFRCVTGEIASIEVNLNLANLDFSDFASAVQGDGVYRGAE